MPFVNDGFAKQDPNGSANLTAAGVVDLFTGTPDGTKFLRDDGTLAAGGGGGGESVQYVVATGGGAVFVAAPSTPVTPVNGTRISVRFPLDCEASAALNVSGSGDKGLRVRSVGGTRLTEAGDFLADTTYVLTYTEDGGGFWVDTGGQHLKAADIPATLNTTSFPNVALNGATNRVYSSLDDASNSFSSGTSTAGGEVTVYGPSHEFSPGCIDYVLGSADLARHSFYDKNGVKQMSIDENGISGILDASNLTGKIRCVSDFDEDETGVVDIRCGIAPRAASTSYNLLAVTANTTGQILLLDSTQTGGVITSVRIKQGVLGSISGDSACYKTTSPTGDECQLSISGGFLVATTGSGYTRSLGVMAAQIGEEFV